MSDEVRVGAVMIDCNDMDTMVGFWTSLLGLDVKARYPEFTFLSRVAENGPALAFQSVPEPRNGKNRMHLDLTATDPEALIARVLELGGSRVEDHRLADGFHWTVLADPEGNVFCVSETE